MLGVVVALLDLLGEGREGEVQFLCRAEVLVVSALLDLGDLAGEELLGILELVELNLEVLALANDLGELTGDLLGGCASGGHLLALRQGLGGLLGPHEL